MGSEWPTVNLGEYIDSCLGKMLDQNKNRGEYLPYLGNKSVRWGTFDFSQLSKMRFEEHEFERYGLKYGDLVVCEGGEPGRCAIWKNEVPNMMVQKALHRIRAHSGLINPFLLYWFYWAERGGVLDSYFTGTTIKHLTGKAIKQLEIQLPAETEQKAIAHILGTLDDKIELNRQINQTLEAMAQALFKSWFVDFDPVIDNALKAGNPIPEPLQAKAAARQALHQSGQSKPLPADVQALFPAAFTFTEEMGWVPEGWVYSALYDAANFINGASFKSQYFTDKGDGKPVIKIAEIKNGVTGQTKHTTQDMPEKYAIQAGDILFSWSGNPDTSIDTFVWSGENAWLNQHVFRVEPIDSNERSWIYFLLKHMKPIFAEIARDKQTTGLGHVTVKDMKRLQVCKPEARLLKAFNGVADDLFHRWYTNLDENACLGKLRDTLLPKLISGELRIPDAEKLVAEAGI